MGVHECEVCGETFGSRVDLLEHFGDNGYCPAYRAPEDAWSPEPLDETGPEILHCPICNHPSSSERAATIHYDQHTKKNHQNQWPYNDKLVEPSVIPVPDSVFDQMDQILEGS